jgi:hypothetical protein
MKPRLHIGWVLFAIAMVWGEGIGDFPRLLFPHRTTVFHFLMALVNSIAVLGIALYALRMNGSRAFWRVYAPLYTLIVAAELGYSAIALSRLLFAMWRAGPDTPLVALGAVTVGLPIIAMAVFTLIALLRLGDWIGPTKRPLGLPGAQLPLPL